MARLTINDTTVIKTPDYAMGFGIVVNGLYALGIGSALMRVPTKKLPFDEKYWPFIGTFLLGSSIFLIHTSVPMLNSFDLHNRITHSYHSIPRPNVSDRIRNFRQIMN